MGTQWIATSKRASQSNTTSHHNLESRFYIVRWWIKISQPMHIWDQTKKNKEVEAYPRLHLKAKPMEFHMKIRRQVCSTCSSKRSFKSKRAKLKERKRNQEIRNIHQALLVLTPLDDKELRSNRVIACPNKLQSKPMWSLLLISTEDRWQPVLPKERPGRSRMNQLHRMMQGQSQKRRRWTNCHKVQSQVVWQRGKNVNALIGPLHQSITSTKETTLRIQRLM